MNSDNRVGCELKTLNSLLFKNLQIYLQNAGLDEATVWHGYIIGYLYVNRDKEIFQKDIERAFCINRSSVTSVLQLMEKKGYIRRVSVERDARLKKLELTEEGLLIQEKQEQALEEHEHFISSVIGADRMNDFMATIRDLKSAVAENIKNDKSKGVDES